MNTLKFVNSSTIGRFLKYTFVIDCTREKARKTFKVLENQSKLHVLKMLSYDQRSTDTYKRSKNQKSIDILVSEDSEDLCLCFSFYNRPVPSVYVVTRWFQNFKRTSSVTIVILEYQGP